MDTDQVRILARTLMKKHGLHGWRLEFTTSFSFAGRCWNERRLIQLNERWTALATDDDVKNTVLHEIAHALVGANHGHDGVWYRTFIEIGGNGTNKAAAHGISTTKRYVIQCTEGCKNLGYRQRRDPRLLNNKRCRKHFAQLQYAENV